MTPHCPVCSVHAASRPRAAAGLTLIELMIVIAIIAIILTLAIPTYTNYTIRAKLGEALSVGAAAKTAVASTCEEDPTLTGLTASAAGYSFVASTWVQSIAIGGDCAAPVITIATRDTGAPGDPQITLTGSFSSGESRITWDCRSTAADWHLPPTCRS